MTFYIVFALVLGLILGTARWVDRRAKRRHEGSIDPMMRSGDWGVNDVMGKDYGAFTKRHATDENGSSFGGSPF